jgi:hypothetical protein
MQNLRPNMEDDLERDAELFARIASTLTVKNCVTPDGEHIVNVLRATLQRLFVRDAPAGDSGQFDYMLSIACNWIFVVMGLVKVS